MLTINNVLFAKNDNELLDSLFTGDKTASGFYKVLKNEIKLYNTSKELIGVITKNKCLAKATKLDNGKYFYNFATIDLIGEFKSYKKKIEEREEILHENKIL